MEKTMTSTSLVCNTPVTDNETINALVSRAPQVLPVLQQFGIDTCCGGALSLAIVAHHHDLDLDLLLGALQQALEQG